MSRIGRGWRLAKDSWAVLRRDSSLIAFPLLAFTFGTIAFVLLIAPGIAAYAATESIWPAAPFVLLAAYGATFASVYFNVALAGAATLSLQGRDTELSDGMAVAGRHRGAIAKWALLQVTVGLVINVIEGLLRESPLGSVAASLFAGLAGAAWSIATFFVVPVLALEGLGPGDALKRSAKLIRERWGEGLVGTASIGFAVFLVVLLPVLIFGGIAFLTLESAPVVGLAAVAVVVLILIAAGVVGSALGVIFRVALFRFATAGEAAPGFDAADLEGAFAPRRGRRRDSV